MDIRILTLSSGIFFATVLITPGKPFSLQNIHDSGLTNNTHKDIAAVNRPHFEDKTLDAGIHFVHKQGDEKLTGLNEVLGSGACAFDYNNDGWVDLFLVNGSGETRYYGKEYWWQQSTGHQLYRNNGDGKFTNVTIESGLNLKSWGMGCAAGDFDNDGDQDLIITNIGQNLLIRNNGNETFTDVTATSGIIGEQWSTSSIIADVNNDGLPDIYITNYIRYNKNSFTYETRNEFNNNTNLTLDSKLYDAEGNILYINKGDLQFIDATAEYGVANKGGRSMSALWIDANDDRFMDLYVINDNGIGSNAFFINEHGSRFVEINSSSRSSSALGHTGGSIGDIDNDGDDDIFVASKLTNPFKLLINNRHNDKTTPSFTSTFELADEARPRGVGSEVTSNYAGWGSGLYDLNNDGWLDLFVTNGLLTPDSYSNKIATGQSNKIWLNKRNGNFFDHANTDIGVFADREPSRGVVFADFNNDGSIDTFVTNNNGIGQLLINRTDGKWIGLRLHGKKGNTDAIGAKVTITTEHGAQHRTLLPSNNFLSSNDRRIHFGLGDESLIKSLTIHWPDNHVSKFNNIEPNQYITIFQEEDSIRLTKMPSKQTDRPTPSRLKLKIGQQRAENRAAYIELLPAHIDFAEAEDELAAGLADNDEIVRISTVQALTRYKTPESLTMAVRAIEDISPNVSTAAIEALCGFEDEHTVRWLLRELHSDKATHRMASAECFSRYFRKEEAVIYRKYLSIPDLISLLNDNQESVIVSAIDALSESEDFRAVNPLIELYKKNKSDERITQRIANALGRIKEKVAADFIENELNSPSTSPSTAAFLVVALKRLSPTSTLHEIITPLPTEIDDPTRNLLHRLNVLYNLLLSRNENLLFARSELSNETLNIYDEHKIQLHENKMLFASFAATALLTKDDRCISLLLKNLSKLDDELKHKTIITALESTTNNGKLVKTALLNKTESVVSKIVKQINERNIKLDATTSTEIIRNKQTRPHALKLKTLTIDISTTEILDEIINDPKASTTQRANAFDLLTRNKIVMPYLSDEILSTQNVALQKSLIRHISKNIQNYQRDERSINFLTTLLTSADISTVKSALHDLAASDSSWARSYISNTATSTSHALGLRKSALTALADNDDRPFNIGLLVLIAENNSDPLNRVALRLLCESESHYAADYLRNLNYWDNNKDGFLISQALIKRGIKETFQKIRESAPFDHMQ